MDVTTKQDYPELFRQYIANGLNAVLSEGRPERLKQVDPEHQAAIVTRALHVLNFVVKMPGLWHQTYELMLALSPYMDTQGRWSEWLPYLQSGSRQAREIGELKGAVKLDVWEAVIYRSMGRYTEARETLLNSAAQFAAFGDDFLHARALNLLAWTERLAGNLGEAQRLANRALLCLKADDRDEALERARSYSILGAVFFDQGDWSQAEDYDRKALQVPQLAHDTERLAWGYVDLGLVLSAQQKYEEALTICQAALEILGSGRGSAVQAAVLQMNLATIYLSLKKPSEALSLCMQAQQVFQRVHDGRRLVMVEIDIGIAYLQMARFEAAAHVLTTASERAEVLGYQYMRINALDQLGLAYLGSGDYDRAITTFQMALVCVEPLQQRDRYKEGLTLHLREAQIAMKDEEKAILSEALINEAGRPQRRAVSRYNEPT